MKKLSHLEYFLFIYSAAFALICTCFYFSSSEKGMLLKISIIAGIISYCTFFTILSWALFQPHIVKYKFLCWFYHPWEEEPSEKDEILFTGNYYGFSSEGVQMGRKKCERCKKKKIVVRKGFVGFGSSISPSFVSDWCPLTAKKLKYIESLRKL